MSREEHFQYGETFAEVRQDWQFHDSSVRSRHESTHTGQLGEVGDVTTGTRVHHHNDWVLRILFFNQAFFQFFLSGTPFVSHRCITLIFCDHTATELFLDLLYTFVRFFNDFCLVVDNWDIGNPHCQTSKGGVIVTQVFETVKQG